MAEEKQRITITAEQRQSWPDANCFFLSLLPLEKVPSSSKSCGHIAASSFTCVGTGAGRGLNKEEIWKGAEKGSGKGRKTLRHCLVCSNRSASTWPGIWENKSDFWSPVSLGHTVGLLVCLDCHLALKKKKKKKPTRTLALTYLPSYSTYLGFLAFLNLFLGTRLVFQWLRLHFPVWEVQVPSLVRDLRSHMPCSQTTKIENRSSIVTNSIRTLKTGTPLVPMVKNPPCTAGDVGSIPCLGTESPPASEKLSPCTATTEPVCSGADVTQPESQCTTNKDPAQCS